MLCFLSKAYLTGDQGTDMLWLTLLYPPFITPQHRSRLSRYAHSCTARKLIKSRQYVLFLKHGAANPYLNTTTRDIPRSYTELAKYLVG